MYTPFSAPAPPLVPICEGTDVYLPTRPRHAFFVEPYPASARVDPAPQVPPVDEPAPPQEANKNKTWEASGCTTLAGQGKTTHACWAGCLSKAGLTGELACPGMCREPMWQIQAAFNGNAGCGTRRRPMAHGRLTYLPQRTSQTKTGATIVNGRSMKKVMLRKKCIYNSSSKEAWLL